MRQLLFELDEKPFKNVAGVDEAGRGPLAGPVVAAACILPEKHSIQGIQDSKKLTPEERETVYKKLKKSKDVHWAIGVVSVEEIDRINILQASLVAMQIAVEKLSMKPDFILVDGLHTPKVNIPSKAVVKGDDLYLCISAASILAKVERDALMREFHKQWPEYGFDQHKGYATPQHLEALDKLGPCPIHRKSFSPVRQALNLLQIELF